MSVIVSDAECSYDPDGSWCYTHRIHNDEHDREITLSMFQRSVARQAIDGLIDEMMQRGFEWDEINVRAKPMHFGGWGMEVRAYKSIPKREMFGVAVYMDSDGRYEFDGA